MKYRVSWNEWNNHQENKENSKPINYSMDETDRATEIVGRLFDEESLTVLVGNKISDYPRLVK